MIILPRCLVSVLFSPAINYVMSHYNKHKATLPPHVKAKLEAGDIHVHTHEFGDYMLKKDFAEDSLKYEINLEDVLEIYCPVRSVLLTAQSGSVGSQLCLAELFTVSTICRWTLISH